MLLLCVISLPPQQGRSQAGLLQRYFSKKLSPGKKKKKMLSLSLREKMVSDIVFLFEWKNGEKLEGNPTGSFAFMETAKID